MTRLERLRERLDERLLVTSLVNIRYLTGFDASNAALLVEPEGKTSLFTDFRYFEAAQSVPGVEARSERIDARHSSTFPARYSSASR